MNTVRCALIVVCMLGTTLGALRELQRSNNLVFSVHDQVKFPCTERICEPAPKYKTIALDEKTSSAYLFLRSSSMIAHYNLTTSKLIRWQHFPQENVKIESCHVPAENKQYDLLCIQSAEKDSNFEYSLLTVKDWARTTTRQISLPKFTALDFKFLDDSSRYYLQLHNTVYTLGGKSVKFTQREDGFRVVAFTQSATELFVVHYESDTGNHFMTTIAKGDVTQSVQQKFDFFAPPPHVYVMIPDAFYHENRVCYMWNKRGDFRLYCVNPLNTTDTVVSDDYTSSGTTLISGMSKYQNGVISLLITSGPSFKIYAYDITITNGKFNQQFVFSENPATIKSAATVGINRSNGLYYVIGVFKEELYLYTNSKVQKSSVRQITNFDVNIADVVDSFAISQNKYGGEIALVSDSGNVIFTSYSLVPDAEINPYSSEKRFKITQLKGLNIGGTLVSGKRISNNTVIITAKVTGSAALDTYNIDTNTYQWEFRAGGLPSHSPLQTGHMTAFTRTNESILLSYVSGGNQLIRYDMGERFRIDGIPLYSSSRSETVQVILGAAYDQYMLMSVTQGNTDTTKISVVNTDSCKALSPGVDMSIQEYVAMYSDANTIIITSESSIQRLTYTITNGVPTFSAAKSYPFKDANYNIQLPVCMSGSKFKTNVFFFCYSDKNKAVLQVPLSSNDQIREIEYTEEVEQSVITLQDEWSDGPIFVTRAGHFVLMDSTFFWNYRNLILMCSILGVLAIILVVVFLITYFAMGRHCLIVRRQRKIQRVRETQLMDRLIDLEATSMTGSRGASHRDWIIQIEDLNIDRRITEGSFGVIFKGSYRGLPVAIKKMKFDEPDEFEREAGILASLRHPNIVLFMGVCFHDEYKLLVTEFMSNYSMEVLLYPERRTVNDDDLLKVHLSFAKKLDILLDVIRGMLYLHQCVPKIVHRDLKPSNILLDEHLQAKVCDFGTSRLVARTGTMMTNNIGTVQYMSPEVIMNQHYDEKCDVYSFGIVMYEMFFQRPPFENKGGVNVSIALEITQGRRPIISEEEMLALNKEEKRFIDLMEKCWANKSTDRPSFDTVYDELIDIHEAHRR